ncbi:MULTISPECIES: hypothetical protein [Gracilibacillus]|uniref:hypothetical protein n=1 Tax=Gracilibacillus TaxID=74385 RepID=UPI000826DE27|nr:MULTISPECIES: hypothetical protein [Gracilibacillus]
MAQLIKLENYISRYQQDIYHYPGQFTRLKRENWQRLKLLWEEQRTTQKDELIEEEPQESNFFNWRALFNRRSEVEEESFDHTNLLPDSEEELKQYFLDTLYPFQLKWASTTINKMSFLNQDYYTDERLQFFLQRIPDTYFVMYHPVFELKNGPLAADIILITPLEMEIIKVIDRPANQTMIAFDDRYWYTEEKNIQTRILSPLISVKRTAKIIQSILHKYGLEMPLRKVILSATNPIEFEREPYHTSFIGRDQHDHWLLQKQQLSAPIKHHQLKIAEALLQHVESVAVKRPEWEQKESPGFH